MRYKPFDQSHYRTLPVRFGYAEWSAHYDRDMAQWPLDFPLLSRLRFVRFRKVRRALDLACGTGRIGAWLKAKGVGVVDGIDLSPSMLEQARRKGVYRNLRLGNFLKARIPGRGYGLITCILATCHLESLDRLYRRTYALAARNGHFVVVDYHPYFLLNGIPTHFLTPEGEHLAVTNHVHLMRDHFRAALAAGWKPVWLDELVVEGRWVRKYPGWRKFMGRPVSFALAWRK